MKSDNTGVLMRLAIGCIASGSSGNSYMIRSESTAILVDAGISGKRIMDELKSLQVFAGAGSPTFCSPFIESISWTAV